MCLRTHFPAQHDLRVADGVRGRDVRSDYGPLGQAGTGVRHLVRLGEDAVGTLAIRVDGHHPKLVDGA